ncbi:MAG: hypothetical protein ACLVJ6_10745 [Merdibacter sp.]
MQYGGTVVALVVKAMYEDILAYMDVEKARTAERNWWLETEAIVVEDSTDETKRMSVRRSAGYRRGRTVIDQLPAGGTTLSEEGRVWIYLGEDTFE